MPVPRTVKLGVALAALAGVGWTTSGLHPLLTLVAWLLTGTCALVITRDASLPRSGLAWLVAVSVAAAAAAAGAALPTGRATGSPGASLTGTVALAMLNVTWALALTMAGCAVLRLLWRQRDHRRRGWELAEALAAERSATLRAALAEERGAMAGEIHDGIGHRLTHVTLALGRLGGDPSLPVEVRDRVGGLRDELANITEDLGGTINLLRAGTVEEPANHELPAVAEDLRSHGADLELVGADSLGNASPHVVAALGRVLREACANAAKHADGAPVSAELTREGRSVRLTVSSRSSGSPAGPGSGTGLDSLRRRLEILDGRLEHTDPGDLSNGPHVNSDSVPTNGSGRSFVVCAVVDADAEPRTPAASPTNVAEQRRRSGRVARQGFGGVSGQALALLLVGSVVAAGAVAVCNQLSVLRPERFAELRVGSPPGHRSLPMFSLLDPPRDAQVVQPGWDCRRYRSSNPDESFMVCLAGGTIVHTERLSR